MILVRCPKDWRRDPLARRDLQEPNAPLIVEDVFADGPRHGEALVEIVASGLCRTDLTALEGIIATSVYPLIPGHEGAGRFVEVGEGVLDLKPGDYVIPLYGRKCRHCRMCLGGRTNLCWTRDARWDRTVPAWLGYGPTTRTGGWPFVVCAQPSKRGEKRRIVAYIRVQSVRQRVETTQK